MSNEQQRDPKLDKLAESPMHAIANMLSKNIVAMQAAVIEGRLHGPAEGMEWIENTLDGPGLLPELDETDAQAFFDLHAPSIEACCYIMPKATAPDHPVGSAQAVIDAAIVWTYCPSAGSYTDGRSVEDCCEELAAAVTEYTGYRHDDDWWSEEDMRARLALSAAPVAPEPAKCDKPNPFLKAVAIRTEQGWALHAGVCPIIYTDTINDEMVGRDDLWLCTTEALRRNEGTTAPVGAMPDPRWTAYAERPASQPAEAVSDEAISKAWNDTHHPAGSIIDPIKFARAILALAGTQAEPELTDALRGRIAYELTKRLVIDMPTARAAVDACTLVAVQAEPVALDFSRPLETEAGDPVKYVFGDVVEYQCARVCVDQQSGRVYSSPYVGLKIRNVHPAAVEPAAQSEPFGWYSELVDEAGNIHRTSFDRKTPMTGNHGVEGMQWRSTALAAQPPAPQAKETK